MDNPATPDVDLDEDVDPTPDPEADASGDDHLVEQTDNSGEAEGDEVPQGPDDVVDEDEDDDDEEESSDGE